MTAVPRLLVLTDRHSCASAGRSLVDTVAQVVAAGAPAVVFREKDLDPAARARSGREVADVVHAADAALIVASDPELARQLDAHGLHLAAADALPSDRRPSDRQPSDRQPSDRQPSDAMLVGRSCHDLAEVVAADTEPLDYLTVSPVHPTASKPGHGPALGVEGVARLAAATTTPALALGGVGPGHVGELVAVGLHGVAVMGGVMGAADPAAVTTDLLDRLGGPR